MLSGAEQQWLSAVLAEHLLDVPSLSADVVLPARRLGGLESFFGGLSHLVGEV